MVDDLGYYVCSCFVVLVCVVRGEDERVLVGFVEEIDFGEVWFCFVVCVVIWIGFVVIIVDWIVGVECGGV